MKHGANTPTRAIWTRAAWITELSRASGAELSTLWAALGPEPAFSYLRAPEIGLVMARGRAGGDGAPFNLGEVSATRCSVRLANGAEGHAYALGRDLEKARIAALIDALMQGEAAERLTQAVLDPLAASRAARERDGAEKAAATKVEFFTMTRGETP